MEAQELGEVSISWVRTQSFPSYVAESTRFAFVHVRGLSSLTVLRLLAVGFPSKSYSVVMRCDSLNTVYIAFLLSVKGLKTLMCKLLEGSFVFVGFFNIMLHVIRYLFCIFIIFEWWKEKVFQLISK